VIAVDDGSDTLPEAIFIPFKDQFDLTVISQPHRGPAAARNAGVARAKGQYLLFTDDDCQPASDWLKTLAKRFTEAPDCSIGGKTINALPDNAYSTTTQLLFDYMYTYFNNDPGRAHFFTSNNLALPAVHFRTIGGFDDINFPFNAEDSELCDRWLYHGYRMAYAPEARVYHLHRLTFRTFLRQHFNYGRGTFRFRQISARRKRTRIKVEPISFYLNLIGYPFSQVQGWRAPLLAALLSVTQVSNTAGFVWESLNRKSE